MTMMREPSMFLLIFLSAALATPTLAQTGTVSPRTENRSRRDRRFCRHRDVGSNRAAANPQYHGKRGYASDK